MDIFKHSNPQNAEIKPIAVSFSAIKLRRGLEIRGRESSDKVETVLTEPFTIQEMDQIHL